MYKPKYFTFHELIKTNQELPNIPESWQEIENLNKLSKELDYIRQELHLPIIVNSGYRSKAVNSKVGGVATSYHCAGRAADICSRSIGSPDLFRAICKLYRLPVRSGQLIYEDDRFEIIMYKSKCFVHFAIKF